MMDFPFRHLKVTGVGLMAKEAIRNQHTGSILGQPTVVTCGVVALIATILSFLSIWLQLKNYRKPLLQRYVVRILLMVPIYAISSWASLSSRHAAFYLDPLRDIYEAFTIYTFFQLLINFLGGERALIIMTHGRQPVSHPWPLSRCLPLVDISDPHTFLAIKRGILQYAGLKPILAIATILMKASNVYQEGYLGITSGYLWLGIVYNISITISLYALALFWVCAQKDLQPFRPMPKFLCIKLIIFASYWQGFGLSILQKLGAITSESPGYTADNLAAAIQDALICFEMPLFAMSHWYGFSWHDYADITISAARMPIRYAFRDAFGPRDLIQDTLHTFGGQHYEYRAFDSDDNTLAHEDSASRNARLVEGMRYERGGKGKYWLPKPGQATSQTPLLESDANQAESSTQNISYRAVEEVESLDGIDEDLFRDARSLEFGDWNYPVVTAHIPNIDQWRRSTPDIITTTTNANLLHTAKGGKVRRKRNMKHATNTIDEEQGSASHSEHEGLRIGSSSSQQSLEGNRSQLIDLVVEDEHAEEVERVRARKEGGAAWNEHQPRRFIETTIDRGDETAG